MKRNVILTTLAAGALLFAACSSSTADTTTTTTPTTTTTAASATTTTTAANTTTTAAPPGDDGAVLIENFFFGPNDISISVGDAVTWTNDQASVGHTTTSDDGIWDSSLLNAGDSFEHTFDVAGTFTYFCSIHPSMTASITVSG